MAKRLVKVAKELNVGVSTIVEHLSKNGFEIESKPTAKVSDEMYDVLLKDFQKSIAIKEQADQLTIGTRKRKEAEDAAKEEKRKAAEEAARKKEEERLALEEELKAIEEAKRKKLEEEAAKKKAAEEAEAKKKAEELEKKKNQLKIKGKIDLDNISKPAKKEKAPAAKKPKKEAPKKVEKKEETPKVKKEVVAKKEAPKKETPKEEPKVVAKQEDKAKEKVETPKVEATKKDAPAKEGTPDIMKSEPPKLKGLKIKGKINLQQFEKPKKKKEDKQAKSKDGDKKERRAPRRQKRVVKRPTLDTNNNSGNNNNNNKSDQDKKEGEKRKRVRKKVVKPQTHTPTPAESRGGNDNRRGGDRRRAPRRRANDEPKEVSKKEIEDKIKATMARLSGGGKSKRQKIRRDSRDKQRQQRDEQQALQDEQNKKLQITEFITVSELASLMDVSVSDVIMTCMNMGVIVSINQRLDAEIIEFVADEFEFEVEFISAEAQLEEEEEEEDDPADLKPRSAIVTVMGHVDHGKTSLLDYIRKANVADGEAGGITQHIGAYEVKLDSGKITFLDTPGHEAFTAMRARGAKVTDIAVIIVAADDRIMPQTKEAISHAEAAGVPIIFAINKIDKPGADPERIKKELAEMNYLVEEWGGKYQSHDISAKHGTNIEELLEKIALEAEVLELQANPDRKANGVVLEASLDKGRGFVTKLLVQTGTLKIGQSLVAGAYAGKVRAMFNERGKKVKKAGPSTPVLLLGLSGAPQAGEKFKVMDNDQEARALATKRSQIEREQQQRATKRVSLDEIGRRLALGNFQELNVIVKGDVDGSIEALSDSLLKLSIESIQVNIIHRAVGQIKESDVLLASASDALIVGFQVRPSPTAKRLAEKEGVEINLYSVIYDAIEEVKSAIEGMLAPTKEEKVTSNIEVRETYKISKVGTVAGCYVQDGKVTRDNYLRIIRDGIVVYPMKEGYQAELGSLKRFKDDVKDVSAGYECGITIKGYNDLKVGDIIETYEIIEVKQTLK